MTDFIFFSEETTNAVSDVFIAPEQGLYGFETSGDFDCCKLELQLLVNVSTSNMAEFETIYEFTEPIMLEMPLEEGDELRMVLSECNSNTSVSANVVNLR
jgi:hypothetical protein